MTMASSDFGAPGPVIDFQPPLSYTLMRDNIHKKGAFEKMTMVDMGAALYAIVERYVRLDGVGYEEQRPRKQLLWLYDQWKRFGVPGKLEEMEREAPYEIATDATTASAQYVMANPRT